jgi:hypothetical protein
MQDHRHPIFIAKHHQPTEAIIHKFIEMGFDMFIIPPLDNDNIEYMLMVYSLINKYKERPDEEDAEEHNEEHHEHNEEHHEHHHEHHDIK